MKKSRTSTEGATLNRATADLASAAAELGLPFMIIGGLAVIRRGVARITNDVDATLWAEGLALEQAIVVFGRHGIRSRIENPIEFAQRNQILLLRHESTAIPLDLSLAWLPFERAAMDRADLLVFGRKKIPVACAEDLVLYKVVAWRDRDRSDVERLLAAHWDEIDLGRVRRTLAEFADALDDPERLIEFDRLVARVKATRAIR